MSRVSRSQLSDLEMRICDPSLRPVLWQHDDGPTQVGCRLLRRTWTELGKPTLAGHHGPNIWTSANANARGLPLGERELRRMFELDPPRGSKTPTNGEMQRWLPRLFDLLLRDGLERLDDPKTEAIAQRIHRYFFFGTWREGASGEAPNYFWEGFRDVSVPARYAELPAYYLRAADYVRQAEGNQAAVVNVSGYRAFRGGGAETLTSVLDALSECSSAGVKIYYVTPHEKESTEVLKRSVEDIEAWIQSLPSEEQTNITMLRLPEAENPGPKDAKGQQRFPEEYFSRMRRFTAVRLGAAEAGAQRQQSLVGIRPDLQTMLHRAFVPNRTEVREFWHWVNLFVTKSHSAPAK